MSIAYTVQFCDEGEPTSVVPLIQEVLAATPEMSWGAPTESPGARIVRVTQDNPRFEILAKDPSGALVGVAVAVPDDDSNVGECLGVQWLFVVPEHRGPVGAALMREVFRLARRAGLHTVAYTRRLGPGRYELIYSRPSRKE